MQGRPGSVQERAGADPQRPTATPTPGAHRWARHADLLVVAALFVLYLGSFGFGSPVHGPTEVFGQDSGQILLSLSNGDRYPWNPQGHLLYHTLIEEGYRAWCLVAERGPLSAYHFMKVFTALTGLGFLLAFRWLLCELGLGTRGRATILALAGLSVVAWFHFGAFETHGLTMPWLALYLVALLRLTRRGQPAAADHILFIVSLVLLSWTRIEGLRFGFVSAVLLVLPGMRALRRSLFRDLVLVLVLFYAGSFVLSHLYLDRPLDSSSANVMLRHHARPSLAPRLKRAQNLAPRHLLVVGRAISVYAVLMPIGDESERPGAETLTPEQREFGISVDGGTSGWLFLMPIRNLLRYPVSGLALVGLAALLLNALLPGIRLIAGGDAFLTVLAGQWLFGWLLYTWFNPFEPFVWALSFMPLMMAGVAATAPNRSRWYWLALGVTAAAVALHNWQWFYLAFR